MPEAAAGPDDHVVAECPFLRCADAEEGGARALVEGIGLELDADAGEVFEAVAELEVFGFGVAGGALPFRGDPRAADLQAPVGAVDGEEGRAADRAAIGEADRGEGDARTRVYLVKALLQVDPHLLRRLDPVGEVLEDAAARANLD